MLGYLLGMVGMDEGGQVSMGSVGFSHVGGSECVGRGCGGLVSRALLF